MNISTNFETFMKDLNSVYEKNILDIVTILNKIPFSDCSHLNLYILFYFVKYI